MIGARLRLMGQLTVYKVTSECLSFSLLPLSILTLCLGRAECRRFDSVDPGAVEFRRLTESNFHGVQVVD